MSALENLLDRIFHLRKNQTTPRREITAGITSFSTVAYIIILIPTILSETGMDFRAVMGATILIAAYSSFLMGILANYPFVLGPGVALSAYFTYSVVQAKTQPWESVLGVVFICGIILLLLNLLRIRQLIIREIPHPLRLATTAGLGLFLALIGLKNAGFIVANPIGFISFGGFTTPAQIMAAVGLITMGAFMVLRIPGAILLGIIFVWILSLIFGLVEWRGLLSWPTSLSPILFKLNVFNVFQANQLSILISFLFVALFDSTGTLIGLAQTGGYIKEEGDQKKCLYPRVTRSLIPDTTGTIFAPMLGTTAVAVYMESAAGMGAGGKTGLTAVMASLLFLLALFFTPFASSIPLFATSPALIIVGGMMLQTIKQINWKDISEWIPAFVTLILIPLTYSVATGIAVGYITYCLMKLISGNAKKIHWMTWLLGLLFLLKFIFLPHI